MFNLEMLITEPILLLMSMYIALIYGLLVSHQHLKSLFSSQPLAQYAFFFSFPVVFGEGYAWNDGLVGLTFLSVIIGVCCALFVAIQVEKDYGRRAAAKGGHADPEDRLIGNVKDL